MKKVWSVMAVSAFVLTAGVALADGPGKKTGAGPDSWYARLGVRAAWMNQDIIKNEATRFDVLDIDADTGFGGAIAFGREFSMGQVPGRFRAEIELAKQAADYNIDGTLNDMWTGEPFINYRADGTIDVTTVFLNGYYELPVHNAFSMYVMAGIGYARYDFDISARHYDYDTGRFLRSFSTHNSNDNVFAYKAGIGVTWNFTDQIAADLGYEYLGLDDVELDGRGLESINSHSVVLSVRFKF